MKNLLTIALSFLPFTIFAHGGHSHLDPNSIIHYLGTPEHAIPTALAVLATAGLLYAKRKRSRQVGRWAVGK